jgi:type VI secretion system protein ImpA
MDIDHLLNPISASAPCGANMEYSTEFDAIKEMRRCDDPSLPQTIDELNNKDLSELLRGLKTADWRAVETQCSSLLQTRSKDMRLAQWWTESVSYNRGYAGLLQGLQLCTALCQRYWEALHPQLQGGDPEDEERVSIITMLLARMQALVDICPITAGASGYFSLSEWRIVQSHPEPKRTDSALSLARFNQALRETPQAHLLQTVETIKACQSALSDWQVEVRRHLLDASPSFVPAQEALAVALRAVLRMTSEIGVVGSADADAVGALAQGPEKFTYVLASRAQALQQLRSVGAYFQHSEPHSPVVYLVQQAVHWGEMPLHVWLDAVATQTTDTSSSLLRLGKEMHQFAGSTADLQKNTEPHTPQIEEGVPPITTRLQALARLRAVAVYFKQKEPHNPASYIAEKAARWGELPLHEWLREVIKEPDMLRNFEELLGCATKAN